MKNIQNIFSSLRVAIYLFSKAPKEYIYSFTYSTKEKVTINKFDPKVKKLGEDMIQTINKKFPELKANLLGSVGLGIAGQRDIDLFIESNPMDFDKYLPEFKKIFGEPIKRRAQFVEWVFKKKGIDVELLLIDPSSAMFKRQITTFALLNKNKKKYALLKERSNGLSQRAYEHQKLMFFYKELGL